MLSKMKIIHANFGIAYVREDNVIEMNRVLLKYPRLYKLILKHEKEHIKNPSFFDTLRIDFLDMFDFEKSQLISKLPLKMRTQANMPIWVDRGQTCINPFLMVFYSLIIIGIMGILVL